MAIALCNVAPRNIGRDSRSKGVQTQGVGEGSRCYLVAEFMRPKKCTLSVL